MLIHVDRCCMCGWRHVSSKLSTVKRWSLLWHGIAKSAKHCIQHVPVFSRHMRVFGTSGCRRGTVYSLRGGELQQQDRPGGLSLLPQRLALSCTCHSRCASMPEMTCASSYQRARFDQLYSRNAQYGYVMLCIASSPWNFIDFSSLWFLVDHFRYQWYHAEAACRFIWRRLWVDILQGMPWRYLHVSARCHSCRIMFGVPWPSCIQFLHHLLIYF